MHICIYLLFQFFNFHLLCSRLRAQGSKGTESYPQTGYSGRLLANSTFSQLHKAHYPVPRIVATCGTPRSPSENVFVVFDLPIRQTALFELQVRLSVLCLQMTRTLIILFAIHLCKQYRAVSSHSSDSEVARGALNSGHQTQ